jgi:hypothetical protein
MVDLQEFSLLILHLEPKRQLPSGGFFISNTDSSAISCILMQIRVGYRRTSNLSRLRDRRQLGSRVTMLTRVEEASGSGLVLLFNIGVEGVIVIGCKRLIYWPILHLDVDLRVQRFTALVPVVSASFELVIS